MELDKFRILLILLFLPQISLTHRLFPQQKTIPQRQGLEFYGHIRSIGFARRIKESHPLFFQEEQMHFLNAVLVDFILRLPGVEKVKTILKKEFMEGDLRSDEKITGVYRFDVLTNQGVISLAVKPVQQEEARDFQESALIGVAPAPVQFIPQTNKDFPYIDGYLVYPFYDGIKLSKICAGNDGAQVIKQNPWIIEQLAVKFARLKQAGIEYEDFLYYNTIVDLEQKTLAIVDYGKRKCADPYTQITQWWLPGLFYSDSEFKQQAMEIFTAAYQQELSKPQTTSVEPSSVNKIIRLENVH